MRRFAVQKARWDPPSLPSLFYLSKYFHRIQTDLDTFRDIWYNNVDSSIICFKINNIFYSATVTAICQEWWLNDGFPAGSCESWYRIIWEITKWFSGYKLIIWQGPESQSKSGLNRPCHWWIGLFYCFNENIF